MGRADSDRRVAQRAAGPADQSNFVRKSKIVIRITSQTDFVQQLNVQRPR